MPTGIESALGIANFIVTSIKWRYAWKTMINTQNYGKSWFEVITKISKPNNLASCSSAVASPHIRLNSHRPTAEWTWSSGGTLLLLSPGRSPVRLSLSVTHGDAALWLQHCIYLHIYIYNLFITTMETKQKIIDPEPFHNKSILGFSPWFLVNKLTTIGSGLNIFA